MYLYGFLDCCSSMKLLFSYDFYVFTLTCL